MRIGIFGGTFNPPHLGHLNSLQEVLKKGGLGKIFVVPANQNPLKNPLEGPAAQDRVEMTKKAVEAWGPAYEVDDQELQRGGKSFTIETVLNYRKKYSADDLYLIMGIDKLEELENWKDAKKIISECNLIFTSRPGFEFPESEIELPHFIKDQVAEFDFNFIELKTGRNIQFMKIKDVEASSTELRKWLRIGRNVEKYIPLAVENYIKEKNLYRASTEKIGDFLKFTQFCGQVLFDKKGIAVRGFDLRNISSPSEFSLIASGTSTRHASSLAENLIQAVKEEYNQYPLNLEGLDEGRWVVVDYGSLIVHVFYDFVRQEYSIENIWKQAQDLNLQDKTLPLKEK